MKIRTSNSTSWSFMLSGLIAIVYGLLALLLPEEIIETVMLISGITIIASGAICFIVSLSRRKKGFPWGTLLIEAIALIALGIVAIVWSKETVKVLIFIIGLWSVLMGAFMLLVLFGTNVINRGFYIFSAILSICFGILLIVNPFETVEVFVTITGIIALLFGIIMTMFGFTIRRLNRNVKVEIVETPVESTIKEESISEES